MKEILVKRLMIDSEGNSSRFERDPYLMGYENVDEWTDGEVRFLNYKGVYDSVLFGKMDVNIIELYKIEK